MAKDMRRRSVGKPAQRELRALGQKYRQALGDAQKSANARLLLARQLYDLAIKTDHAQLHVDIHTVGKKRAQTATYKLTDPRATLLLMERFCNVWVPVGQLFCINKFGCPGVIPPPKGFWIGCVLIGCFVNVCPAPGAPKVMCLYLCL